MAPPTSGASPFPAMPSLKFGHHARVEAAAAWIKDRTRRPIPTRELWLNPTLADIRYFAAWWVGGGCLVSLDIETAEREITSIAFAPDPYIAICIPFCVDRKSYWASTKEEVEAWKWVRVLCESPNPKVLQNGSSYDLVWLLAKRRIRVLNCLHDTRLMHHALYPEFPKSLQFMGSIWENEQDWKKLSSRKSGDSGDGGED